MADVDRRVRKLSDLLKATGDPVNANPVAAKLGKLGMPEPLSALAAMRSLSEPATTD